MKRLTSVAVLALAVACHHETPPTPPEPTQSIPMDTGYYWIYQQTDTVGAVDTLDTTVILSDTIYNGYEAYNVAGYLMGQYDTAVFYCADSNIVSVYDIDLEILVMTVEGPLMPQFLSNGQHWQVFTGETTGIYYPPFFDSSDVVRLSIWGMVEESTALSVPAGSFDPVYRLHYEDTIYKNGGYMLSIYQYSWVAPGTGIIKRDDDEAGTDPTAELLDCYTGD